MDKKEKLLTLASGKKFVVIEQCEYNGKKYCFANQVIDGDVSEVFKIFSIDTDQNGKEALTEVVDDEIIKSVSKIMSEKMK